MRLSGRHIDCIRGGREVFSGLDFQASSGEALAVVGPNGSGKTSLLRLIAGLLVPAGGSVGLEGGEAELTLPEQSHYLGHRDALKPALSVFENLSFWRDFLGGRAGDLSPCLKAVGLGHATHLPAAYLPASVGGFRSRACSWCGGRSGSWTSRPRRSIPPGRTCSLVSCASIWRAAASSLRRPTPRWGSTRGNCAWGARHDRPRRTDSPGRQNRVARRRRGADRRAVFPHGHGPDAVRDRARPGTAGAARTRDPLARRAAGEPAHARSPVHGRPRGWLARPDR